MMPAAILENELIHSSGTAAIRIANGPDGLMAVGTAGLNVTVSRNGEPLWTQNFRADNDKVRPTQRVRGLAFSDAGEFLYLAASDEVQALSTRTGEVCWSYLPPRSFGFLIVSPIAIDSRGDTVSAAFDNGCIATWDTFGQLLGLRQTNDSPRTMRLTSPNQLVGTDSFSICVWEADQRHARVRRRLAERALGFDVSQNGLVARRSMHHVRVESLDDGALLREWLAPTGLPLVAISSDGGEVAFTGGNGVSIVRLDGEANLLTLPGRITALTYSERESQFIAGDEAGLVYRF
jgi:hypothetical protein